MLDTSKPMKMKFLKSEYNVTDFVMQPEKNRILARGLYPTWHCYDLDGFGAHPSHRLVNCEPPPRLFKKKAVLVEWWNGTYLHTVTPRMEAFEGGFLVYFHKYVPGKVIAITTIDITEGEGLPTA